MADSLEYLRLCQVCWEEFTDSGDHVPRLLPCTHTLCEKCIKELLDQEDENVLKCPECRQEHQAPYELRSFPQNKYLLTSIATKAVIGQKETEVTRRCPDHGKELNIYCKEKNCQKNICLTCVRTFHRNHSWIEVENLREKSPLSAKIETVTEELERIKKQLRDCENDLQLHGEANIAKLEEEKAKITRRLIRVVEAKFGELAEQVVNVKRESMKKLAAQIDTVDQNMSLLSNINQNATEGEVSNDNLEIVEAIEANVVKNLSARRSYKHMEYVPSSLQLSEHQIRKSCGALCEKVVGVGGGRTEAVPATPLTLNFDRVTCRVTHTVNTGGFDSVFPMALVAPDTVVLLRKVHDAWTLTSYSLQDAAQLQSVTLTASATAISEVKLRGEDCIAVTYHNEKRIDFHDAADLSSVLETFSTAPRKPGSLCSASDSLLLAEVTTGRAREIRCLDCSSLPVDFLPKETILLPKHSVLYDMCSSDAGTSRVLLTSGFPYLSAYTTRGTEWKVDGKNWEASGVTADDSDHLFVCHTRNRTVQLRRVSDGRFQRDLLRCEEHNLGQPLFVRWNSALSALILLSYKHSDCYISVIKLEE